MTTELRRITISLSPAVDEAITQLAEQMGKPHSKVVTSFLEENCDTLKAMAKVLKQIKAGQTVEAKRTLTHVIGDQMATLLMEQQASLDLQPKKGRRK